MVREHNVEDFTANGKSLGNTNGTGDGALFAGVREWAVVLVVAGGRGLDQLQDGWGASQSLGNIVQNASLGDKLQGYAWASAGSGYFFAINRSRTSAEG